MLPKKVTIVEVGARDGLQNEARTLSVDARVTLIKLLAAAGLPAIEVGSFVSEKHVPQMANSGDVLRAVADTSSIPNLPEMSGVRLPALVPNLRGLEAAIEAGAREVAVFTAASEMFSEKNVNCSIDESIARIAAVLERAAAADIAVRGYVSCVLGCPYQGDVPLREVARVCKLLVDAGCYEISLGDTIGVGTPEKTRALLEHIARDIPIKKLAVHFHDTYGQALANIYAALQLGVQVVDSAVAGLGGCPFAEGASGNVATEDVVYMLNGMAIESGVSLDKLLPAGDYICAQLNRRNHSKVALALKH